MKKRISILLVLVITLIMAAPAAVFAAAPPPTGTTGGSLSIEYKYVEGEEPTIPLEITRFGFRYFLVSQSAPVLESTLPNTRTYNYRIEGALTQEQIDNIQGLGDVTFTPIYLIAEREIDRERELTGWPTNDVESIEKTWPFPNINIGSTTGVDSKGTVELTLTGVTFTEITKFEDIGGPGTLELPALNSYNGIAVYRGVETFSMHGYYYADMVYTSIEGEDQDVYVIVAEYATEDMPPPIDIEAIMGPTEPTPTELTLGELQLIDQQSGNPIADIINGLVPMGNFGETFAWSFLSLILSIAAIYFSVVNVLGIIMKRRQVNTLSEIGVHDEDRLVQLKKRGNILRMMTIFLGAMTMLMWLYLDTFNYGMVWINAFTPIVGILCGFTLGLRALTNYSVKKAMTESEVDSWADTESPAI